MPDAKTGLRSKEPQGWGLLTQFLRLSALVPWALWKNMVVALSHFQLWETSERIQGPCLAPPLLPRSHTASVTGFPSFTCFSLLRAQGSAEKAPGCLVSAPAPGSSVPAPRGLSLTGFPPCRLPSCDLQEREST